MFSVKEKIKSVTAEEILDSRGNPTVAVTVATSDHTATASVPSGASTGFNEAVELRDGDADRFGGLGVTRAVRNVNEIIAAELTGKNPLEQRGIDDLLIKLDGTNDKSKLGANAILGVSLALARLSALITDQPLWKYLKTLADIKPSRPLPYIYANFINGGRHAFTPLPFQEYVVVPQTDNLEEALQMLYQIQSALRKALEANLGDEGGFIPATSDVEEPLKLLQAAAKKTGFSNKVKFAMDVAASSFYEDGEYLFADGKMSKSDLMELYKKMDAEYPLLSIEDPFSEEDFDGFAELKTSIKATIIGDDLTVTNKNRLQQAIDKKSIGGVIIKPNQIGTLSETLVTMMLARDNNLECIVSHRSGETNDDFIVDLAVAFGAFGLKIGALQRGERIAKYNRLMTISRTMSNF